MSEMLRRVRDKEEYAKLQRRLHALGFYEESMELEEMRQVLNALEETSPNNPSDSDAQQPSTAGAPFQSGRAISTQSSTDSATHTTEVVTALIHHPLVWSPAGDTSQHTRLASQLSVDASGLEDPDENAERLTAIEEKIGNLLVILADIPSSSKKTNTTTSNVDTKPETSASDSIAMPPPSSAPRVQDSGLHGPLAEQSGSFDELFGSLVDHSINAEKPDTSLETQTDISKNSDTKL